MRKATLRTALAVVVAATAVSVSITERLAFVPGSRAYAQAPVELLPDQPVPPGFETQTLFLICNLDWIRAEREQDLLTLYAYFQAFGRAIGPDNAAVWFWKELPNLDQGLADAIDIERGSQICSELELVASESPYLVINSKWDQDHAIVALSGLDSVGIKEVLVVLADKLIASDINIQEVQDEVWWETLYSALRSGIASAGGLARTLTVSIDTKFFSVKFDGDRL